MLIRTHSPNVGRMLPLLLLGGILLPSVSCNVRHNSDSSNGQASIRNSELLSLSSPGGVLGVAFSPDGKTLAAGGSRVVRWPRDPGAGGAAGAGEEIIGDLKLRDAATGREVRAFPGDLGKVWSDLSSANEAGVFGPISQVVFSPDGKRIAAVAADLGFYYRERRQWAGAAQVKVWDVASGQLVLTIRRPWVGRPEEPGFHFEAVEDLVFSPDGQHLQLAWSDQRLDVWDLALGKELKTYQLPRGVWDIRFSQDGRRFLSGSPVAVRVWDVATHKKLRAFSVDDRTDAALSSDGEVLAVSMRDGSLKIWDVVTGQDTLTLKGRVPQQAGAFGALHIVAFSPDGTRLAVVTNVPPAIEVWSTRTGQEIITLQGDTCPICGIAFSPDGQRLASVGSDSYKKGEVKVWDIARDR